MLLNGFCEFLIRNVIHKKESDFKHVIKLLKSTKSCTINEGIDKNLVVYVEKLMMKKSNKGIINDISELSSDIDAVKFASFQKNSDVGIKFSMAIFLVLD